LKDYDRALADCDTAIRLDPRRAMTWANRARIYREKQDFERAIADARGDTIESE
jgi:hypothetical protein